MSVDDLLSALFGGDVPEGKDQEEGEGEGAQEESDGFTSLDSDEGDDGLDLEDEDDEIDPDDVEDFEIGGAVESFCPYCGESMEIFVDPAGGAVQEYVEDCSVCCNPSSVRVTVDKDGMSFVELDPLD